jgi:predicted transcriptional regulator of viral defense system
MTRDYLENHPVFTLEEYMAAVDPSTAPSTRETNLRNAVARGQARRLARGLYASNVGASRDRTPLPALVASRGAADSVLSHHTALDVLGVAHSVSRLVVFASCHRVESFDVDGYRFRRVAPPRALGTSPGPTHATMMARAGDELVRVTGPERTLVDCLMRPDLGGGLEEVLRSVGGLLNVDGGVVADYVQLLRSPAAGARAGWLLEMMVDQWHTDRDVLARLRSLAGRGPYGLLPASDGRETEFVAGWRLYVPKGLPYTEWVRS